MGRVKIGQGMLRQRDLHWFSSISLMRPLFRKKNLYSTYPIPSSVSFLRAVFAKRQSYRSRKTDGCPTLLIFTGSFVVGSFTKGIIEESV